MWSSRESLLHQFANLLNRQILRGLKFHVDAESFLELETNLNGFGGVQLEVAPKTCIVSEVLFRDADCPESLHKSVSDVNQSNTLLKPPSHPR